MCRNIEFHIYTCNFWWIYIYKCMYLGSQCLNRDCWSLPVEELPPLWLVWTTPPAAVVFCYKYYQWICNGKIKVISLYCKYTTYGIYVWRSKKNLLHWQTHSIYARDQGLCTLFLSKVFKIWMMKHLTHWPTNTAETYWPTNWLTHRSFVPPIPRGCPVPPA